MDFLPVSTRLHPQLQAGDRKLCVCVCLTQGILLHSRFLILKTLLTLRVRLADYLSAHTPYQNVFTPVSFLFFTSRFDLKVRAGFSLCGPDKCSAPGLHYLLVPPTHHGPLNAIALCVCVRVCVCVGACVCVIVRHSYLCQRLQCYPPPHTLPPSFLSPCLPLPLSASLFLPPSFYHFRAT